MLLSSLPLEPRIRKDPIFTTKPTDPGSGVNVKGYSYPGQTKLLCWYCMRNPPPPHIFLLFEFLLYIELEHLSPNFVWRSDTHVVDNLPYKSFIRPFLYQRIVTSEILTIEFGEHSSSDKESVFRRQIPCIHRNPPFLALSISWGNTMIRYRCPFLCTKDKVSGCRYRGARLGP